MKLNPGITSFALGGLIAAAGLPALAGGKDPAGANRFPISVESIEARRSAVFAETDTNGDGLVSVEEFMEHEPDRQRHRFHRGGGGLRDKPGGQGAVDDPERAQAMDDELFAALDTNGDGTLSRAEFGHQALTAARQNQMKQRMFQHLDGDGDAFLSPAEFPPAHLADMDTDGDGEITREELRQGRPGHG